MVKLKANDITVLNLTREPDGHGQIWPPECFVTGTGRLPVWFADEIVGWAKAARVDNQVVADLTLAVHNPDTNGALETIATLVPCVSGVVTAAFENMVLGFRLTGLHLVYVNQDPQVPALGDRLQFVRTKDAL